MGPAGVIAQPDGHETVETPSVLEQLFLGERSPVAQDIVGKDEQALETVAEKLLPLGQAS